MYANCRDTNKSPKMLNAVKNKFDTVICWQMGKILLGDFKVTTLKNPLINNYVVTIKRNLTTTLVYPEIPTYSWTFALIPNWTWCCSSLLSFVAQISNLWLTLATWIVVGCKVLHFINNEDHKALGYKTLWRTNTVASHKEK